MCSYILHVALKTFKEAFSALYNHAIQHLFVSLGVCLDDHLNLSDNSMSIYFLCNFIGLLVL